MISYIAEFYIEQVTLDIVGIMEYEILFGPDIAPDRRTPERVRGLAI